MTRVGVDTGGTFTDAVAADGTIAKVLSDRAAPDRAVAAALHELAAISGAMTPEIAAGSGVVLAHGTTVATNALLERRGVVVALVTNDGFADVIEIARQDRPSLYDPFADRPTPLVPRQLRFEVRGRLGADGSELEPLDLSSLPPIPDGVDAVAVCLLHSDLNDLHERAVGAALAAAGHDVSLSVDVSPEFREYERTLTTVVNAYLRPACRPYLSRLGTLVDEVLVMASSGGLISLDVAAELPAALLLSGPAGGVRAAAAAAAANGFPDCITFDMGGTSTDVCLVQGAVPSPAPGRTVGGFPIRLPSLDVHTIGAGGGSIARIDAGGALAVGPESAGADPGPACYRRGGEQPTVTDANLVAGRIPADAALPGLGVLSAAAATAAIEGARVTADGVIAVVNAHMEQALRAVSVARGVDPRGLALVAFGGAGPLHACDLADALGMPAVIVPARAGVLSAVGMLAAPQQREVVRSSPATVDDVAADARRLLGESATVETFVDARYVGQSHEITVPTVDAFHGEHERRNGFARRDAPIEVVAVRARASIESPLAVTDLPPVDRRRVAGPAVIAEPDCTIVVAEGWLAEPGDAGAYVLRRVVRGGAANGP